MNRTADYWIQHLQLQPHPEGGAYARVYASEFLISQSALPLTFSGDRHSCTHIYYLLEQNDYSGFHRIQSDELWHHYDGKCLCIYEIDKESKLTEHLLGKNIEAGEKPFCVIKAGSWFASRLKNSAGFVLVGCTVSPGFDFAEFEMAEKEKLTTQFPAHNKLISELCRK
jgi:predicted cupin superfamily sugar epimerase